MLHRILPHPGLSALLVIVWLLLVNQISAGALVVAILLAIVIPLFSAPFWPDRPTVRYGWPLVTFVLVVLWDIVVANFEVAWIILFRRSSDLRTRWLAIPLELRSPEAITLLAGTISVTPGTVSCDVSDDGRYLLVHALDVADEASAVARIKQRYESRLVRVFPS